MGLNLFLSASIPLADRDKKYYNTIDIIAIRDAVRALAATVLPHAMLVWGGHPAITPLFRSVLLRMDVKVKSHVTSYQSKFFIGEFPEDNECVENICLTDMVRRRTREKTRNASLEEMRRRMLTEHEYAAGIFIGGMEGVEDEFKLFKKYNSAAFCIPVASTGGAAFELFESKEKSGGIVLPEGFESQRLKYDFDYRSLFLDLFGKSMIECE